MTRQEYAAMAHAIAQAAVEGKSLLTCLSSNLKLDEDKLTAYIHKVSKQYGEDSVTRSDANV